MKKAVNKKRLRELADIMKKGRAATKLSLREVSKQLGKKDGLSFSNLAKLERAEYPRPPIIPLIKLAKIYNLADTDKIIILAEKIPPDVYWRIVENPALLSVVRRTKLYVSPQ